MGKEYDLVVLGGGTGGYVAAIRASQLGMKVAVVEAQELGGTCLHAGCIPTKSLLRTAETYRKINEAKLYGIEAEVEQVDFTKVQGQKDSIIKQLQQGIEQLFRKHRIDRYRGYGRILGSSIFSPLPGTISVEYSNGKENSLLIPKFVLIATGSKPKEIEGFPTDGQQILHSEQILQLETLPKSILIIGGGIIGIEWASILVDFGVEVTLVEREESILPTEDESVQREVTRLLKKRGVKFLTQASIDTDSVKKEDKKVSILVKEKEKPVRIEVEKILVAIGREANITDIGLQNTKIELEKGYIKTKETYQTKESHIYAIGDCIGGLQLAHVAQEEAILAIEHMMGKSPQPLIEEQVPINIYSYPEVARIGLTEREAREQYEAIDIGVFPFRGIGKAHINRETEGFMKIIVDRATDDLIGLHIVGDQATELIATASLAKGLDASAWELSQTMFPHPSISELFKEAALASAGFPIHG